MRYDAESNVKHREPWQRGRRGSLCPKDIDERTAQGMLQGSDVVGTKRYAVRDGRAYCAQEHRPGLWHGYPLGWAAVPFQLRQKWKSEGLVRRRDIRRNWD